MTLGESTFTWQNNLVRIGFLLGACGIGILLIFVLFALTNYNAERPGDVAVPLILCAVVLFLMVLTGVAIVREQIKTRLPRIKVLHLSIALVMVLLFFGVKSFIFGLCIGFIMLMSIFLLEEFDSRLRGVAVCAALICLVITEASRRAGGYDSGGLARYIIDIYSFCVLFLPALLVMSTLRKLPLVTRVACFTFAVLSLHSAGIVCAGMKNVLDDMFGGASQQMDMYEKFSEQYCIKSTISSPLGFLVAAFQEWKFPPHQFTNTTTTTQFVPTVITTTLFDCSLLGQVDADGTLSNTDSNSSNETVYGYNSLDGYNSMDGVDLSHCYPVEVVVIIDPNSTATTTTSTTSTSTTSTVTTSTTSTSTSSTSTTVTTTITTTTSSTTTTTSSSSTLTTNNVTTATTTSWFSQTTTMAPFIMTPTGHYCLPGNDVNSEVECRRAATALGLVFEKAWNGAGDHKLCAFADDNREKVFFNTAPSISPYAQPSYASICYRETPYQQPERCTRSTAEGQEAIRVTSTGYWAIAVFALSGAWIASLWFVIIMVRLARSSARVHPTGHHGSGSGVPLPGSQLALGDVQGEDAEEARLEEEIELEKKRSRRCKLRCRRRWTRCKRCCPCCVRLASCCKKCSNKCGARCKCLKKICKFLVKTQAALIGTAIFAASAIGIVIIGGTQVPMEKPYCARKPRLSVSLLAWAEEPTERAAVTWCEYGPIASVGLGFISFCCFLLAFSMTLVKVRKMNNEDQIRQLKIKIKRQREQAAETGDVVESATDYGPGFRIQKMVPKEKAPLHVHEDYDGRVFDV